MYDSSLDKRYVSVNLRVSKTDPYRQGCTILLFATNYTLCPYVSLQRYLNVRNAISQEGPLFCHKNGEAMTRSSFINLLHVGLQVANVPVDPVSGHSLRKGFATSAAAVSVQDNLISTMGRWSIVIATSCTFLHLCHLALMLSVQLPLLRCNICVFMCLDCAIPCLLIHFSTLLSYVMNCVVTMVTLNVEITTS